jgi:hypothetical protein
LNRVATQLAFPHRLQCPHERRPWPLLERGPSKSPLAAARVSDSSGYNEAVGFEHVIMAPPIFWIGLLIWKLIYVGHRPLSRGVKFIVAGILVWSLLPIIGWLGLLALAAMGGQVGD